MSPWLHKWLARCAQLGEVRGNVDIHIECAKMRPNLLESDTFTTKIVFLSDWIFCTSPKTTDMCEWPVTNLQHHLQYLHSHSLMYARWNIRLPDAIGASSCSCLQKIGRVGALWTDADRGRAGLEKGRFCGCPLWSFILCLQILTSPWSVILKSEMIRPTSRGHLPLVIHPQIQLENSTLNTSMQRMQVCVNEIITYSGYSTY